MSYWAIRAAAVISFAGVWYGADYLGAPYPALYGYVAMLLWVTKKPAESCDRAGPEQQ